MNVFKLNLIPEPPKSYRLGNFLNVKFVIENYPFLEIAPFAMPISQYHLCLLG
jgi:hypothetical protein